MFFEFYVFAFFACFSFLSELFNQLDSDSFYHLKMDHLNLSFVKDIDVVGKKMTRSDLKTAI